MHARVDYKTQAAGAYKAMSGLEHYLHTCGLEEGLIHLIKLRASQINGCAFCIDMHWKDLRAIGENEPAPLWARRVAREPLLHRSRTRRADLDGGGHPHYGGPRVG
jgi:AhpD family alkylhydroperoxidase